MKGLAMTSSNIVLPCLLTALITAYATTWFLNPNSVEHPLVTIPPLLGDFVRLPAARPECGADRR